MAVATVSEPGTDLATAVSVVRGRLFADGIDAVYVDLPMELPETAALADDLEGAGLSFAGMFPNCRGAGDVLRLQSIGEATVLAHDIAVAVRPRPGAARLRGGRPRSDRSPGHPGRRCGAPGGGRRHAPVDRADRGSVAQYVVVAKSPERRPAATASSAWDATRSEKSPRDAHPSLGQGGRRVELATSQCGGVGVGEPDGHVRRSRTGNAAAVGRRIERHCDGAVAHHQRGRHLGITGRCRVHHLAHREVPALGTEGAGQGSGRLLRVEVQPGQSRRGGGHPFGRQEAGHGCSGLGAGAAVPRCRAGQAGGGVTAWAAAGGVAAWSADFGARRRILRPSQATGS